MGERILTVSDPNYWKNPVRPLDFESWKAMYDLSAYRQIGFWQLLIRNKYGEIVAEDWIKNTLMIIGAKNALTNLFCATSTINGFKYIAISNGIGVTALTSALTSGQSYSSLSVDALTAAIPSGTTITIGKGTGQEQNAVLSSQANSGATAISINSITANANYAIGTNVSPTVDKTANPSSLPGSLSTYSSALANGDFTYSSDSSSATASFSRMFSVPSDTTAGTYTGGYVVNKSPVDATGQIAVHVSFAARRTLLSGDTFTLNISESITPS